MDPDTLQPQSPLSSLKQNASCWINLTIMERDLLVIRLIQSQHLVEERMYEDCGRKVSILLDNIKIK